MIVIDANRMAQKIKEAHNHNQREYHEFVKINRGKCPECNGQLDHSGYCDECHLIPALNPEYQKWANA